MGFWFFLTAVILGRFALKAYQIRLNNNGYDVFSDSRVAFLEKEIKSLREELNKQNLNKRVEQLEETVLFSDFELKRTFSKLEEEMAQKESVQLKS